MTRGVASFLFMHFHILFQWMHLGVPEETLCLRLIHVHIKRKGNSRNRAKKKKTSSILCGHRRHAEMRKRTLKMWNKKGLICKKKYQWRWDKEMKICTWQFSNTIPSSFGIQLLNCDIYCGSLMSIHHPQRRIGESRHWKGPTQCNN